MEQTDIYSLLSSFENKNENDLKKHEEMTQIKGKISMSIEDIQIFKKVPNRVARINSNAKKDNIPIRKVKNI